MDRVIEQVADEEVEGKFIEEFLPAIREKYPLKPGMVVEVLGIDLMGNEASNIVPVISFKLPNGDVLYLGEDNPVYDPDWYISECQATLQQQTNLSPAGIRRRLRRVGIMPALTYEPSEAD